MKLKHLATIDWIVSTIFVVMIIPFWVPAYALQLLKKPFAWVLAWGDVLRNRLCNWLARQAEEVRNLLDFVRKIHNVVKFETQRCKFYFATLCF